MAAASASSREDAEAISTDEGQKLMVESLSGLGQMAGDFCCILAQPELSCAALNSLGFLKCVTSAHFTTDFWATKAVQAQTKGLLIAQVGLKVDDRSLEIARALSRNANVPSILVVVIAPMNRIPIEGSPDACARLASVQHRAQEAFISSGADDVVMLDCHEPLSGHRVLEAVHRIEILARRLSQEIDSIQQQATKRVEEVKELASRKLQVAWRNQMWTLPGAVLECIPAEDASITEWPAREEGGLGGVGGYAFEAKLGGGSFGTVFKAQHKDYGTVAVKVIQKHGVKNVSQLFSLNQELGIMTHLPRRQHATAAMTSFHTSNCIYLVMEYAGSMSLHKFVRSTLATDGSQALPRDLARSFCVQMAVALSHLHSLMVCHRDLKPANFIVSDQGHVLSLVDFGFAAMLCSKEQRLSACCGSLPFCAPEVLKASAGGGRVYDPFSADVWSLSLNFVEMACGPYSIEKCLGWVPQHPSDPEQRKRDIERLEGLWAKTPDTGIEGLGNTVSHMLVLQSDKRWTIPQVLGNDGLGVGLVASPPSRRGRTMKMPSRDYASDNKGVQGRAVDLPEDQKGESVSLLERVGGSGSVRAAVEKMFDTAIASTSVGVLLGRSAASIPSLRTLYVEEVTAFFETVPGQGVEQGVLDRLGDAHRPWDFSDAMFDALVDHFSQALSGLGMRADTVQEATNRFRALRVKVTAGYRAGCTFARKQNTAAWRSKLGSDPEAVDRAIGFATALAGSLSRHPNLGPKVPQELRNPDTIKESLTLYLNSDAKVPSPLTLQIPQLSLVELGELMDLARQALVESFWGPDEVLLLQFAMSDEWDHIRLNRALSDLAQHTRNIDRVAWTTFTLRLQMAFMASPCNKTVCENTALPMCLARICEVLVALKCEDPWQLSFNSCSLSISDQHFDSLIDQIPGACTDLQPVAAQKVVSSVQAMRAFVVQGCTNTARAG